MSSNRLSEMYLTADSVGGVVRADRTGALVVYHALDGDRSHGPDLALAAVLTSDGAAGTPAYVADSAHVANDDEPIVNEIRIARVGGEQRVGSDPLSRRKYGPSTFERSDLISKSDVLVDFIISTMLANRADRSRRLATLSLDAGNALTFPAIIGLDVHALVDVELPPLDGATVAVAAAEIDAYTHSVTPLTAELGVIWAMDITFGIQESLTITEAA